MPRGVVMRGNAECDETPTEEQEQERYDGEDVDEYAEAEPYDAEDDGAPRPTRSGRTRTSSWMSPSSRPSRSTSTASSPASTRPPQK